VAAALPLMRRLGSQITTRQIAEAAGVAEGTIFRVFPDKAAVLRASFEQAWDPGRAAAELAGIDPDLDLPDRLARIIDIIATRVAEIWQLFSMVRTAPGPHRAGDPGGAGHQKSGPSARGGRSPEHHHLREQADRLLTAAVEAALAPAAEQLRISPAAAARLIGPLVFGCVHPQLADENRLSTADIVDFLLDGLRARPGTPDPVITDLLLGGLRDQRGSPDPDVQSSDPPAKTPTPPPTRAPARTSC